MPRVAVDEIILDRDAIEAFGNAAYCFAVNFVGINEEDPRASVALTVQA
jgi:hypothetical protein